MKTRSLSEPADSRSWGFNESTKFPEPRNQMESVVTQTAQEEFVGLAVTTNSLLPASGAGFPRKPMTDHEQGVLGARLRKGWAAVGVLG